VFVQPVYRRLSCTEQMAELLRVRNMPGAIDKAVAAADADPLDAASAMEVVRLRAWSRMLWRPLLPEDSAPGHYDRRWAAEAIARNRHDSGAWILAGEVYLHTAKHAADAAEYMQSACRHFSRAVELNPSNGRLRLQYARVLLEAGRHSAAAGQIDAAEKINARIITLTPQSLMQFGPAEKAEIKKLRVGVSGP
jgi:tetratricopeptide (TPR) repeat protein